MMQGVRKVSFSLLILVLPTLLPSKGVARDAAGQRFDSDYKKKFVVVLRDGMAVGFIADPGGSPMAGVQSEVYVEGDRAEVCRLDKNGNVPYVCRNTLTQPVRRGEVFRVERTFVSRKQSHFGLNLTTVSPHSVQRGVGAFAHESLETGKTALVFKVADPDDYSTVVTQIGDWLKPFESAEEAVKFGNTASGVFVRGVKLGMTFAEVERALGLPQTRVDLGAKVLYRYQDMTIEFHDGKVADVR